MYIWTGIILPKKFETKIRNICRNINKNFNVSEQSFTLPQHISLKTSFNVSNYQEVIDFMKELLKDFNNTKIKIKDIGKINGVIWLEIEENSVLRNIHNLLNEKLFDKFNIPEIKFDGKNFKFHSTLFQDLENNDKLEIMYDELRKEIQFPIELDLDEINFGVSNIGKVGTYKVIDHLYSKNIVYLKQPQKDELYYRQEWMKDPKTMNYNAGYDIELKGYNRQDGTICKSDEEMLEWYEKWKNDNPDTYFSYIYLNNLQEPIGEIYYYLDNEKYNLGILIQDKYRGKGFSKIALELLCENAKQNGITELYDTFEYDRINTIKTFEKIGFKVISKGVVKKFDKEVETITMKIEL